MKRWTRFILGVAVIILFIKVIPMLYKKNHIAAELINFIEMRQIDTSALFYTEEPHTFEAYQDLREKMEANKH